MKKFKASLALMLGATMMGSLFTGCNQSTNANAGGNANAGTTVAANTEGLSAEQGKELTIYGWNEEFKGMLENYYLKDHPLPEGVTLNYVINPSDGGVYQQKLDQALQAGEKIDLFLMEADYAKKYVNSEYTKNVFDVGITDADLTNQYQYTIDVAKDPQGTIKGLSWQAAPGLFIYRTSLAEKYLGVKTPEEMQNLVKDWDAFTETARKVNEASAGATKLVAGMPDIWQVFRTNRSSAWVQGGKLIIDPEVDKFMELAKTLQGEGLTADATQWSDAWNAGFGNDSVLGYFMSTWGIQWTMVGNSGGAAPGEGTYGDWTAITGPQSYYWGGTWIAPCKYSDNDVLVGDIIKYFTVNKDSMKNYCLGSKDYVNNKAAIQEIIDGGFAFDFLGGQDHYSLFQKAADAIDTKAMTGYDQDINTDFQEAYTAYSKGELDKDAALAQFKSAVTSKFADITAE